MMVFESCFDVYNSNICLIFYILGCILYLILRWNENLNLKIYDFLACLILGFPLGGLIFMFIPIVLPIFILIYLFFKFKMYNFFNKVIISKKDKK